MEKISQRLRLRDLLRRLLFLCLVVLPGTTCIAITAYEAAAQSPRETADELVRRSDDLFEDSTDVQQFPDSAQAEPLIADGQFNTRSLPFGFPSKPHGFLDTEDAFPLFLSYDRADGLFIGIGTNVPLRNMLEHRLRAHLGFGYAFGSHYWQITGGIGRDFLAEGAPLRIELEGHLLTDTKDAWKVGVDENSLMAALAGIDARDYFQRRGASLSFRQFMTPRISAAVAYRFDSYRNSVQTAEWSLFGPQNPFDTVPHVEEGTMQSVMVEGVVDYLRKRPQSAPRLGVHGRVEVGSMTDFFTQILLDIRFNDEIVENFLGFAVRGRIGSVTGEAPPQKQFTLGGFGTLPGYPRNGYGGNRMLLLQTDLRLALFPGRHGSLQLILSNNFGQVARAAATASPGSGFFENSGNILYAPGIYIGTPRGIIRAGASWRTDIGASPTFVVRLSSPY